MRRGMLLLAVGLLAAASTVALAPPGAATHDEARCERADPLFGPLLAPTGVRQGAVYEGLSRWYEHEADGAGPTEYQLVSIVGDADLHVYDADCETEAECSSTEPGHRLDTCTVPGKAHVIEVRGTDAPQATLGIHYALRAAR